MAWQRPSIAASALIIGIESFRFGLPHSTTTPQIMQAQLGLIVIGMMVEIIAQLLLPEGAPHALILPTQRRWRSMVQGVLITGFTLVGLRTLWMIVSVCAKSAGGFQAAGPPNVSITCAAGGLTIATRVGTLTAL